MSGTPADHRPQGPGPSSQATPARPTFRQPRAQPPAPTFPQPPTQTLAPGSTAVPPPWAAQVQMRGVVPLDASAPPASPTGTPPVFWRDQAPLDTDWDPARWYHRFSLRTRVLATLLALLLIVGGLTASGAFKREATVTRVDYRTAVMSGPFEITFLGAEFRQGDDVIHLRALCRLVHQGPAPVLPHTLKNGVRVRLSDGTIVPPDNRHAAFSPVGLGPLNRDSLAPGMPATPCRLSARVAKTHRPGSHVQVVVLTQHFSAADRAQTGGPGWFVGRGGVMMYVPLLVLPKA